MLTYHQLVRTLQRGGQVPVAVIEATLHANGKTADDLIKSWLSDPPPKSGDRCASCGGRYVVTNTRVAAGRRIRYLGCRSCGYRPPRNKTSTLLQQ